MNMKSYPQSKKDSGAFSTKLFSLSQFQCNALCDEGYTVSFFFRHDKAPKIPVKYDSFDLSDTAKRVIWLAERLPNVWTKIYMDNLYNSKKLFSALFEAKCLGHEVTRPSGRGIPDGIKQAVELNVKKAEALKGTTMAAQLAHDKSCPHLLAVCVYDQKPVHVLSMAAECVEWVVKKRKVFHHESNAMKEMKYLRLNIIDEYNSHMNQTDIADQLRGQYRPDAWMRNKKWWWSIFIWALGVAATNGYKIYCTMWDEDKKKGRTDLPKKWSHAEFLEQLVYDMIFPQQTILHRDMLLRNDHELSLSSFGGLGLLQEEDNRE